MSLRSGDILRYTIRCHLGRGDIPMSLKYGLALPLQGGRGDYCHGTPLRKPWFPLWGPMPKVNNSGRCRCKAGPPLKMIIFRGGDRSGPTNLWELVALTTTAIVNTRRDPRGRRSVCCLHAAVVIVAVVCGCHARLLRLWLLLLLLLLLLSLCEKERERLIFGSLAFVPW